MTIPEVDQMFNIAEEMRRINKERFLDTLTILESIDKRRHLEIGKLILVHRKFVVASKKLGNKSWKTKLHQYWEIAKILSFKDERIVLLQLQDGATQRAHIREVRQIKPELYGEYKEIFDKASAKIWSLIANGLLKPIPWIKVVSCQY